MPTSTNVTNLKINTLTETQYDTAVQGGVIGENELSIITDLDTTIQVSTMPTASATEEGNIYQYIGTTDANYINGYFYKCVSDGQNPATYSWSNIQVQASSGGLPTQTGNAGKFLTTDGTDASWAAGILYTSQWQGYKFRVLTNNGSKFGLNAQDGGYSLLAEDSGGSTLYSIEFGSSRMNFYVGTSRKMQIGSDYVSPEQSNMRLGTSTSKWGNVYTTKINNGSDITVPNQAGTLVVATPPTADGTYVLKATVSSGVVTYTWVAE